MATSGRVTRHASVVKPRQSRRQPCFTMKRPLLFQVRKSLVEYVDDELLRMGTSVFYQRIFILAKNLDPNRETQMPVKLAGLVTTNETAPGTAMPAAETGDDDLHYTQQSTPDDSGEDEKVVKIVDTDSNKEAVQHTFRFDGSDDEVQTDVVVEELEVEAETEVPELPKDAFTLFSEKLRELEKKCRQLAFTPDPMCGLFLYMNEYTMLMLEGAEDVMGIFCGELLEVVGNFWKTNRVFMIEDHINDLYTKELVSRRIPAAWLNEKFPTSTPSDEYLMGKQHLIIRDKLYSICGLISEQTEPKRHTAASDGQSFLAGGSSEQEMGYETDEEIPPAKQGSRILSQMHSTVRSIVSEHLSPDIFRKLLPEIQRIELVLASTRFYYTLDEFYGIYGTVPFRHDTDSEFWPIQNNYAPPNIFRRTPFDINLTFAEYAAEMSRRMQEEQDAHKAQLKAEEEAAANAAAEKEAQTTKKPQAKEQEEEQEA